MHYFCFEHVCFDFWKLDASIIVEKIDVQEFASTSHLLIFLPPEWT